MGNVAYSQASIGVITFCCQVYTFISIKHHFTKKKDLLSVSLASREICFLCWSVSFCMNDKFLEVRQEKIDQNRRSCIRLMRTKCIFG